MLLSSQAPTRYAVRQVLDQELRRTVALRENHARQARFQAGADSSAAPPSAAAAATAKTAAELAARLHPHDDKENGSDKTLVKKDFFGRVVQVRPLAELSSQNSETQTAKKKRKVLGNVPRRPEQCGAQANLHGRVSEAAVRARCVFAVYMMGKG